MNASSSDLAIVILAAGQSKRMGEPKAFIKIEGQTLLDRTISNANATKARTIYLVTGAYHEQMIGIAQNQKLEVIYNNNWQEGMASSLRKAIEIIGQIPQIQGVLVLLIDQPFVDAPLLKKLIDGFNENPSQPIASFYKNVNGVPAIFPRSMWKDLLELKGDKGARQLLNQREDVVSIPFENGAIDLDFPTDFEQLKRAGY